MPSRTLPHAYRQRGDKTGAAACVHEAVHCHGRKDGHDEGEYHGREADNAVEQLKSKVPVICSADVINKDYDGKNDQPYGKMSRPQWPEAFKAAFEKSHVKERCL